LYAVQTNSTYTIAVFLRRDQYQSLPFGTTPPLSGLLAIDAEGRAIPYCGYVFIGTSYEMPAFAVDGIVEWWCRVDRERNAEARELLILADCGGANGDRSRVWKYRLYRQLCEPYNLQRPDEE